MNWENGSACVWQNAAEGIMCCSPLILQMAAQ